MPSYPGAGILGLPAAAAAYDPQAAAGAPAAATAAAVVLTVPTSLPVAAAAAPAAAAWSGWGVATPAAGEVMTGEVIHAQQQQLATLMQQQQIEISQRHLAQV